MEKETKDIERTGYHKCDAMPKNLFAEKQQRNWHIHDLDLNHSEYRVEILDEECPFCGTKLEQLDLKSIEYIRLLIDINENENKIKSCVAQINTLLEIKLLKTIKLNGENGIKTVHHTLDELNKISIKLASLINLMFSIVELYMRNHSLK